MDYSVIAYYCLGNLEDPRAEVKKHQTLLEELEGKGRIYVSEQGFNAQLSLPSDKLPLYVEALKNHPFLSSLKNEEIKVHAHPNHAFAKLIVRYRKQLVAIDCPVDLAQKGEHLTPEQWKEKLETPSKERILIDVRNEYEWKVGHFEGSVLPNLTTFRQFPQFAKELKERIDPEKTEVLMTCTGGIRCEFYSAVMKQAGFKNVYQLYGGIINYGLQVGQKHWKGKLFVFDDRLVVPISSQEAPPIAECSFCKVPCDTYYNCANMQCNDLFISCPTCVAEKKGCCCSQCEEGKVRPFDPLLAPTPYRRLSHEQKCKL